MPGAQLSSSAANAHFGVRDLNALLRRSFVVDGLVMRRLGALLLIAGGLLAWSPIHPGLLCPLRATTGVPCPTCGMTTSVKACLNLDFGSAFAASPGGIAALLVAALLVVTRPHHLKVSWVGAGAAMAFLWIWQLFRFDVL